VPIPVPVDSYGSLTGVACPSTSQCTAVDDLGQEVTFDPVAPGSPSSVTIDSGASIAAVTCPSATECTAVDNLGQEVTFSPAAPAGATPDQIPGADSLTSISCSSTTQCVAVDVTGHGYVGVASATPYTLALSEAGTGTGTVISSPAGIDCGSTCSIAYPYGTEVTLTADAGSGSTFAGWSGAGCSGTDSCQVTMNAAASVTATFDTIPPPPSYTLSVSQAGSGSGTVTSSPAGIDCGPTCSHDYASGTQVTLTAVAASGSTFTGWSGAGCSGTDSCQVTMNEATAVTATLAKVSSSKACVVPNVKGKTVKAAKSAIKAHGCRVGIIKHSFSNKVKKGHVISQKARPHKRLKHGAKVNVVVSKGKKARAFRH